MKKTGWILSTNEYLKMLGVKDLPPLLCPFDPGYDPVTLESHLEQSAHFMTSLKISMACWIIAAESATRRKIAAAQSRNIPVVTGGGPFEVAAAQGQLDAYLDLCAGMGVSRIECGEGFTTLSLLPKTIVNMAADRGLTVQFEMGKKHEGSFTETSLNELIKQGDTWLEAGAEYLVVEARESAEDVGLFNEDKTFNARFADRLASEFGLETLIFEAPTKYSQFILLDYFGPQVHLGNIRIEEILRVEIYRRGLHSDAFAKANLRPELPVNHKVIH